LNRNAEEEQQGVIRFELVTQRDGVPEARALFQVDQESQRLKEFTAQQRDEYDLMLEEDSGEQEEYKGDL
jgi:hypothetical protein